MIFLKKYYKKFKKTYLFILIIILISIIFWLFICLKVPKDFPKENFIFHIEDSATISSIANNLYTKNIISSPFIFKATVLLLGGQKGLFAGDYRFIESQNSIVIAYRMVKGIQGLPKIKITIPEGTNSFDMAYIYMTKLPNFNAPKFLGLALKNEGYLFPDTYFFLSNASSEQIIKEMKSNFNKKVASLKIDIDKFIESKNKESKNKNSSQPMELKDVITMASIVEEEAKSLENRQMVAGILWKRLEKGMLLQVDPPFYYITGKTNGVTYKDLNIDSPYNTYKYKGLPIGPISNPGLDAIKATVTPIKTTYYFYLTGKDGKMRYAVDHAGHIFNRNMYLK